MSDFDCQVSRVENVDTHPDEGLSHLSIVTVLGKNFICGKLENGEHRYNRNDLVFSVPVGGIIPKDWLKHQGFYWDAVKDRGVLGGNQKNRVTAVQRGSVTSDGLLFPVEHQGPERLSGVITNEKDEKRYVISGESVKDFLGIVEYEPK
jgi:hypothetical protein